MQIIRLSKLLHDNITLQGKYKSKQMPELHECKNPLIIEPPEISEERKVCSSVSKPSD